MKKYLPWIPKVIVAIILLQTLAFKFTSHPDSVALFSALGVESWGRYATGVIELFTSILILIPKYSRIGAFLASGIMAGAILSHLVILGISVNGDGGALFGMAVVTFLCAAYVFFTEKYPKILGF